MKTEYKMEMRRLLSSRAVFLILFLIALCFRIFTFSGVKWNGYDEAAYSLFMNTLNINGIEGIRRLIQQFPHNDVLLKAPLPFRILFPFVGQLSCKILKNCDYQNLAIVSLISGVGIICVSFILFKKWFTPVVAILASLLIIVSPLGTSLSRRALQDSFFTLIVVTTIFFFHQCWFNRKIRYFIILGLLILAGLLTKESMIFLYPSFLALFIYYRKQTKISYSLKIIIPFLSAPFLYLLISSWIAGGFHNYLNSYIIYLKKSSTIDYAVVYQKGPWFRYIVDFILLSPLTSLFSIIGMVITVTDKKNMIGRNTVSVYVLSSLVVFSLLPILNVRLLLFLDVLMKSLSVIGLIYLAEKIDKIKYRRIFIVCIFLLFICVDIFQFYRLFVKSGIYDPVTINLIQANKFIKNLK